MQDIPYAEDVGHYWNTSKSAPDAWLDKARQLVESVGGQVVTVAFASEPHTGRAAYMMEFVVGPDRYKIVWPVLPSRRGNDLAARRQAATALFHDVKARVVAAKFLGVRTAFLPWLVLPSGRPAAQASDRALEQHLPALAGGSPIALPDLSREE